MRQFFPLWKEQIEECEEFRGLTPHEKVLYWYLQSEFNRHGTGWYQADLRAAVATGMSKSKVEKARKRFKGMGWIAYRPGFQSGGRNLATTYQRVRWADPPEKDSGQSWAQMHRYAFEAMLDKIRSDTFTHADVCCYVILCYWYHMHRHSAEEHDGWWFIPKRTFRQLTGIQDVDRCMTRLYENYRFSNEEHLFEYRDEYHRYAFTDYLIGFADPSEDENNREQQQCYRREIEEEYQRQRKRVRRASVHPRVTTEALPGYWCSIYPQNLSDRQKRLLMSWGREYGVEEVCREIDAFLGERKRAFSDFEKHWEDLHGEDAFPFP